MGAGSFGTMSLGGKARHLDRRVILIVGAAHAFEHRGSEAKNDKERAGCANQAPEG